MTKEEKLARKQQRKAEKVGLGKLLLWNSSSCSVALSTLMLGYATFYCTDVLQLAPALVGTLFMVSKIFDSFTDVVAGFIVDRTQTRWGKGRPYEIFMLFLWLSTWLLFSCPTSFATAAKCIWIFCMYTFMNSICVTFLNANNVVYMVRAFENKEQQSKIVGYGSIFTMAGAMVFNVLFPTAMAKVGTDAYSMLGALRLAAPHTEFLYAQGYPYAGNEESGHDAALQIAKDADLVICTLGGHYGWNASCTTGEGIDAMHIGLPVCQERFLEKLESLHKPVVGVHFDGHPISSDTADRVCNAILEAWAPGAQGGEAIAALLTGTANPCGKLPCTVARHEGQIPVYYNHPTNTCYSMTGGTPKNAYIDGAHTPRYCFGHGLSYTKYEYDTLQLEKDAIQADGVLKGRLHVRNAGNKAGTEIVQFYVHDVAASMVRPVKELVGFAKVDLQPGEEKTVCLSLPMSQLAFLDADMRWKVEHGKVELMVGASSEDIRGKAEFMIVGDAYPDGKNRSFVADTKIM